MRRSLPEWFTFGEEARSQVMGRIAELVSNLQMSPQVRYAPMLAHWFILDNLLLANLANRRGMHANALALTRQCLEAIGVVELGVCGHPHAEATLLNWEADRLAPGKLRAWLESNVWPRYGSGMWTEPWADFMRQFAAAVQPYAHYGRGLAQWQVKLLGSNHPQPNSDGSSELYVQLVPRAYDTQKATRITLFHAILLFALGRIWMAANPDDKTFAALINRLRVALSKSQYLDGHQTDWSEQFWAFLWDIGGGTILE